MVTAQHALAEFLRRRGLRLCVVCAWMGIIWGFSSMPHSAEWSEPFFGDLNLLARKLAHACEYAILTFLFWQLFGPRRRALFLAVGAALLYSITDEIHQGFVPGRGAYPADVLIDAVGIAAAGLLIRLGGSVQKR
jgi:hypothetical protein